LMQVVVINMNQVRFVEIFVRRSLYKRELKVTCVKLMKYVSSIGCKRYDKLEI